MDLLREDLFIQKASSEFNEASKSGAAALKLTLHDSNMDFFPSPISLHLCHPPPSAFVLQRGGRVGDTMRAWSHGAASESFHLSSAGLFISKKVQQNRVMMAVHLRGFWKLGYIISQLN